MGKIRGIGRISRGNQHAHSQGPGFRNSLIPGPYEKQGVPTQHDQSDTTNFASGVGHGKAKQPIGSKVGKMPSSPPSAGPRSRGGK